MSLMRSGVFILMVSLAACAGPGGDTVVTVPSHIPVAGALAAAPKGSIGIAAFSEPGTGIGVLPGRIGERKTIGNLTLGMVALNPPPGRLIQTAIEADLAASGWQVGGSGAAALTGDVTRFALRTDVTPFYWDVVVDAALMVHATMGPRAATRNFTVTRQERTYVWPSDGIVAGLARACADDLARQVREDTVIAQVFGAS